MNIENIHDIHWHDAVIRKVIDLPDRNEGEHRLFIELDYPVNWADEDYQIYTIQFVDVYAYEIHEGPCVNVPTILEAKDLDEKWGDAGIRTIRIETTSGYRLIRCRSLSLEKGEAVLPTIPPRA